MRSPQGPRAAVAREVGPQTPSRSRKVLSSRLLHRRRRRAEQQIGRIPLRVLGEVAQVVGDLPQVLERRAEVRLARAEDAVEAAQRALEMRDRLRQARIAHELAYASERGRRVVGQLGKRRVGKKLLELAVGLP